MNEKIIWQEKPSQILNLHIYIIGFSLLCILHYFINYHEIGIIKKYSFLINNQNINQAHDTYNTITENILLIANISTILYLYYRFLNTLLTTYTLTEERLIIKKGILMRTTTYTDLYRIIDYSDKCYIIEKMYGIKTVMIYTNDKNNPILILRGIKNASHLVSTIRKYVEELKIKRNVYEIN